MSESEKWDECAKRLKQNTRHTWHTRHTRQIWFKGKSHVLLALGSDFFMLVGMGSEEFRCKSWDLLEFELPSAKAKVLKYLDECIDHAKASPIQAYASDNHMAILIYLKELTKAIEEKDNK